MNVNINNAPRDIPEGLTIAGLLTHQQVKMPDMVSVQLNGVILKRQDYASTTVHENDNVEFLYFMGGGQLQEPSF